MDLDYGVQKARMNDDVWYGLVHGASIKRGDVIDTMCGLRIDSKWCIKFIQPEKSQITCKKCSKLIK